MPTEPVRYSFDLASPDAAREMAQEMADKSGCVIIVTEASGRVRFRVQPARRNEVMILPKQHRL